MNQFCEDKILKKLNNIQGVSNSKDTLLQYAKYVNLSNNGKIKGIGNSNIIIKCDEDYIDRKRLVNIIVEILDTDSFCYLTKKELKNDLFFDKINEKILIIDGIELRSCSKLLIDDIKYRINANKDKTFIIVSCDLTNQDLAYLSDCITWCIETTSSTAEEKQTYIINQLKTNGIKVSNNCNYISTLADKEMTAIEPQLINCIINCKVNNVTTITNEFVNKNNLFISNTEDKIKSKTIISNKKTALEELDELIGLEDVKLQIKKIVNYVKTNRDRHRQIMLHMALLGNAGCGKNELARLIGRIFKEQEVLSIGEFIEVSRADLVGEYIGQSAIKTRKVIEKAKGSVLFIDEAYSLDPKGSQKEFGHEVIAELIKAMEDYKNDLCVIFAGYTEEIEQLLKVNRGFNSRVPFKIYFDDYTADELYNIFREMAKFNNYKLAGNIKSILVEHFEQARQRENFGNGRYVRNLLDKVGIEQAQRVATYIAEDKDTIKLCDVKNVLDNLEIVEPKKRKIGFAI